MREAMTDDGPSHDIINDNFSIGSHAAFEYFNQVFSKQNRINKPIPKVFIFVHSLWHFCNLFKISMFPLYPIRRQLIAEERVRTSTISCGIDHINSSLNTENTLQKN